MTTIEKKIVLVGGGHAHLQVIKALHKNAREIIVDKRIIRLDVTLVDPQSHASYSGMVPGCVAGLYPVEQSTIDLQALAQWANITFVQQPVVDMNLEEQYILVVGNDATTKRIPFDVVSMDIGSASRGVTETMGAMEYSIPTRPISSLVSKIQDAQEHEVSSLAKRRNIHVVVVGAGAAGIELAFALQARWGGGNHLNSRVGRSLHVTLLDAGSQLLPHESDACRQAVVDALQKRNITVRHNSIVKEITKDRVVLLVDNNPNGETELDYTHCLWAAGAAAHPLAVHLQKERGLSVDNRGWIVVSPTLQSCSHPCLFAAGDCATIEGLGRNQRSPPKAGVYAVRSGPILLQNIVRYLKHTAKSQSSLPSLDGGDKQEEQLVPFEPQDDFLKLLMCGDGTAIGFRFGLPLQGKWVWDLKNHIDTMFMDLFDVDQLPDPDTLPSSSDLEHSVAQYDAEVPRPPPLAPEDAATLLQRVDDHVQYQDAWNVLRDMMVDEEYKASVIDLCVKKKPVDNKKFLT